MAAEIVRPDLIAGVDEMGAVGGQLGGKLAVLVPVDRAAVQQDHPLFRRHPGDGFVELADFIVVDVPGQLVGPGLRLVDGGQRLQVNDGLRLSGDDLIDQDRQTFFVGGGGISHFIDADHDVDGIVGLLPQSANQSVLLAVHVEQLEILAVGAEHAHAPGPAEGAVLQAAEQLEALGAGVPQEDRVVKEAVIRHGFAFLQRIAEAVELGGRCGLGRRFGCGFRGRFRCGCGNRGGLRRGIRRESGCRRGRGRGFGRLNRDRAAAACQQSQRYEDEKQPENRPGSGSHSTGSPLFRR